MISGADANPSFINTLALIVTESIGGFNSVLDRLHRAVIDDLAQQANTPGRDLGSLKSIKKASVKELSRSQLPILGLGFAAHPPAFGEPGLVWWHHGGDGRSVEPVGFRTKPGTIDFYDYTKTEWWCGSIADNDNHIFGPYVDHSGTNAYILTFARTVRKGGTLFGLVVLDVQVGRLQSMWQAPLLRLPRPCSVINAEGVVIATNDGTLMADVLEPSLCLRQVDVAGTGWSIILGAPPRHSAASD